MMEMAIIVVLTLCVVIIIPWMMKKDFEQRMLAALKREITHNITRLKKYTGEMPGDPVRADDSQALPVLKDEVFRKIQQADFCSKGLSDEDRDTIAGIFALFSRHVTNSSNQDREKLCTENMRALEEVLARIERYIKSRGVR